MRAECVFVGKRVTQARKESGWDEECQNLNMQMKSFIMLMSLTTKQLTHLLDYLLNSLLQRVFHLMIRRNTLSQWALQRILLSLNKTFPMQFTLLVSLSVSASPTHLDALFRILLYVQGAISSLFTPTFHFEFDSLCLCYRCISDRKSTFELGVFLCDFYFIGKKDAICFTGSADAKYLAMSKTGVCSSFFHASLLWQLDCYSESPLPPDIPWIIKRNTI